MLVGERLKLIRESKKLSQGDIEKKTGMLRCYVSRVENNWTVPSIETLVKWTGALEVSMSELFADNGKPAKPIAALKNGNGTKLNRKATSSLRRIESAFVKMKPFEINLVTGLALK